MGKPNLSTVSIDLQKLLERENHQVEWKERVADIENACKSLVAFANDFHSLGGGYLVCGVRESKDLHGSPLAESVGLTAAEAKRVSGELMVLCREKVSPPISPHLEELEGAEPGKKVLVFTQPRTGQAHSFRGTKEGPAYWIRLGSQTRQARNGLLRDLLVKTGATPPWELQPCNEAKPEDLDLLKLRGFLSQVYRDDQRPERFLSAKEKLHALVEPLLVEEPLTGLLRPRNFAILLFGKQIHRFFPYAYLDFAVYPEFDRSGTHSQRTQLMGDLFEQIDAAKKMLLLHNPQRMDKEHPNRPNYDSYPKRALEEALVNAVVHRDYSIRQSGSITVFLDRIEFLSRGALPEDLDRQRFLEGTAGPFWRNRSLSWFTSELQYTQAQGQGIPTIIRALRRINSEPRFDLDNHSVTCTIPAHARHTQEQLLRQNLQHLLDNDLAASFELLEEAGKRHHDCQAAWSQAAESLRDLNKFLSYAPRPAQLLAFLPALLKVLSSEVDEIENIARASDFGKPGDRNPNNSREEALANLKRLRKQLGEVLQQGRNLQQGALIEEADTMTLRLDKIQEWLQAQSH